MSSSQLGKLTSVEVVDISAHGMWLLAGEAEHFMPFGEFPWFKTAPISAVLNVVEESPGNLHWPELDIDLCLESIKNPERFPLKATNGVRG
jgi:hypothetical protein